MSGEMVRQNINFMENPLWLQNQRAVNHETKIDTDKYQYICTGTPPGKRDQVFLYYTMHQLELKGWPNNLNLSYSQILKNCGMSCGEKNRFRIHESMSRWEDVKIRFKGTFYDNRQYKILSFRIINSWYVLEGSNRLHINFAPEWVEALKNTTYYKYISFAEVKKIRSPLALRLYEILSKSFYKREQWEIGVFTLAKKIPLFEKYASQIIRKIQQGVTALNKTTQFNITLEIQEKDRNDAILIFKNTRILTEDPAEKPSSLNGAGTGKPAEKRKSKSADNEPSLFDTPIQTQRNNPVDAQPSNDGGVQIPGRLILLIPQKDLAACLPACRQIMTKYGEDGLEYYLKLTKDSNPTNFAKLLNFFFNNKTENFYEDHLKVVEYQKQLKQRQVQAQIAAQEEMHEKKCQEQIQQAETAALDLMINNMTPEIQTIFLDYILGRMDEIESGRRVSLLKQIRNNEPINIMVRRQFYPDFIKYLADQKK